MAERKSQRGSNTKERIREPEKYNVVMHNDDVTTMDFVVKVLRDVFHKSQTEATNLMLDVHNKGKAVVGTYQLDIALSKTNKALLMAREEGFPFRMTVEPCGKDL